MSRALPRVVIVGAGFGGLASAKRLAGKPVDVTIVDRSNHHLFQPLLYQVATAALSPADIAAPIRSIFARDSNIRVLLDEAAGIDSRGKRLILNRTGALPYDWLILSTGAQHSYFGHDEWSSDAPGLKTIRDALEIRRKVLLALEFAETESDIRRRRALLTFVVIGGGPTGVEMAGSIAELTRRSVSRDFRSITPRCSRVVLVEAGPRILPSFPEILSARAEADLTQLGVEVRTGSPVTDIGPQRVRVGAEAIDCGTSIWAAGVQASPAASWIDAESDRLGRIFVEQDLRVPGHADIFAIGDTANCAGPGGAALPGIAPVAKQQGKFVADAILGRPVRSFRYRDFGNLATIGRSRAVIDWGGWHSTGLLAWLTWCFVHVMFLVGFRSRLAVAAQWLWNYFTFERSARLITADALPPVSHPARRRAA